MDPIAANNSLCRFEGFRLDRRERQLSIVEGLQQTPITLGSRSMEILLVLVSRAGHIVSKNDLMDAVWPGVAVEENNLTVQVSALRRVLDAGRKGPSIIQTVPGRGYRFVGPVMEDVAMLSAEFPPQPGRDLAPVPPPPQARRWRISALALVVLVSAGAVAAVLWPAAHRDLDFRSLSVVLIPFTGVAGDEPASAVAAAMTDELAARLTMLPGAFVVPAQAAPAETDQAARPQQVARLLSVRYALTGSVRHAGPELQIFPRLINAATGAQHPVEPLRITGTNLTDIRQNAILSFTAAVTGTLLDAEAKRIEAIPVEQRLVTDLLLQVDAAMRHVVGPEQNKRLIALLERALALQPHSPETLVTCQPAGGSRTARQHSPCAGPSTTRAAID